MSDKKWSLITLGLLLFFLAAAGAVTVIIDPYFHYHAPLACLEYPLYDSNARYQNDGIGKHFSYDAIITGTSMTQNFKTSELNALFDANAIKVCFTGARYKEINENLERAAAANPDLRLVVRGLDFDMLLTDRDFDAYDEYPDYLYDDSIWNDVQYIFNKSVLIGPSLGVLYHTLSGDIQTSFDTYGNWSETAVFGKEQLENCYVRSQTEAPPSQEPFTEEDRRLLRENLEQNVIRVTQMYPHVTFYLFITPYSIYYWDSVNQAGTLSKMLTAEKEAIELLLPYENIRLFSFFDEFEMICNPDNYKDPVHYGEWINSQILLWMQTGEHELTEENYQEYCERVYEFYMHYDYEGLFGKDPNSVSRIATLLKSP